MPTRFFFSLNSYEEFKSWLATSNCPKCPELCRERHSIVVDRGNPHTKIVLIGEAPGEQEDLQGKSFVGRSGRLLDKLMASVGLDTNQDMLILNVVKCRPPNNRPPTKTEAHNCLPYLQKQLELVRPTVIVLLGATAAKYFLTEKTKSLKSVMGRLIDLPSHPQAKFMILYHPAYLLRDPRKVKDLEAPLQELKRYLDSTGLSKIGA